MSRVRRWVADWRLALRVARRDAARARGRSILAVVMIALPVLAVTAADVVMHTQDVSSVEGLDRRLGSAEALVTDSGAARVTYQAADPDESLATTGRSKEPLTVEEVRGVVGADVPAVGLREGPLRFRSDDGVDLAAGYETALGDELVEGLLTLEGGRWPRSEEEVVVNSVTLAEGVELGGDLVLPGRGDEPRLTRTVVGVAESGSFRTMPVVAGLPGALGLRGKADWLVGGGDVTWDEVQQLNRIGALVLSRAVVHDPPPPNPDFGSSGGIDDATLAVLVLVVVMVLLEVVLLAGPAFAVGARRQARTLALMAACGGTPPQARRVVLGSAVVLGSIAAVAGVLLGIGLGALLVPVLQQWSDNWFGPFQVPWLQLLGVAAFGLVSALLAAMVPAWLASRQDVVAVLAGRRGDRPPSLRSPLLGLVVVGLGVGQAVYGARSGGEIVVAASAVVTVLGMILLIPVVVATVARLARRLPLPLRFAARDAARHRTRTVPAVAAVAATVAGVVALGIGVTSDEAENREGYRAELPMGQAMVSAYGRGPDWPAIRAALERHVPAESVTEVRGVTDRGRGWTEVSFRADGTNLGPEEWASFAGAHLLVAEDVPPVLEGIPAAGRRAAREKLAAGGVAILGEASRDVGETPVVVRRHPGQRSGTEVSRATLPAVVVEHGTDYARTQALVSPAAARELGLEVSTVSMVVGDAVTDAEAEALEETVAAVHRNSSVYVERGYQADDGTVIAQLILAGLGAVLMLGGTLTATFLALSDARPDLATLAAVGAAPRTRRAVAAAYALVIGFVGAVLGAAVGFVPGIAVTYPLTHHPGNYCVVEGSGGCQSAGVATGPFIDVPWLLVLGLVVVLPLLTAGIVALATRSRLPVTARVQ